jgi:hypothetical protein
VHGPHRGTLAADGWVTSAHLQACIGYDARSGVILLRDPTERHYGEMFLDGLLETHPLDGPRAMLMVPADQADLMAGLELPDEAAYDAYHRLRLALDSHERAAILAASAELTALAPEGMLARVGEADVAAWKRDWVAQLAALDLMLERAPEHQQTQLRKAGVVLFSALSRDCSRESPPTNIPPPTIEELRKALERTEGDR